MNKKQNTERQTRKTKNAECENAVSLRHGLGNKLVKEYFCRNLDTTDPEIERTMFIKATSKKDVIKIVDEKLISHGLRPYKEKPYDIYRVKSKTIFQINGHNQEGSIFV
jgi:hypothetical protein